MSRSMKTCCLMIAVFSVIGCSADGGSSAPVPAAEVGAVARAAVVVPSFTGIWTGTAQSAPVINAGLAPQGSDVALVLPLASLFGQSDVDTPVFPPFTWTITCLPGAAGGVTGNYSDDAGRSGALSGTTDGTTGIVQFVVSGTAAGGSFVLRCSGVLSAGPQAAEFEITQMSLALDGGASLALTSTARLVPAPPAVISEDAVLIEEDILDP